MTNKASVDGGDVIYSDWDDLNKLDYGAELRTGVYLNNVLLEIGYKMGLNSIVEKGTENYNHSIFINTGIAIK